MKKIIELKNITKAFDGEPVLQNVNLRKDHHAPAHRRL